MNDLPAIYARICRRLKILGMASTKASSTAGRPDAIRNLKRAVENLAKNPHYKPSGISTATITDLASVLKTTPEWILFGSGSEELDLEASSTKQPRRPHFIADWMQRRSLSPAELSRQTGPDPGLISRWLRGASPSEPWQEKLGEFFVCGRDGIFRHPDEEWIVHFLKGRSAEEVERIKLTLEIAFPKSDSGD
jgi:hypothetical protein